MDASGALSRWRDRSAMSRTLNPLSSRAAGSERGYKKSTIADFPAERSFGRSSGSSVRDKLDGKRAKTRAEMFDGASSANP